MDPKKSAHNDTAEGWNVVARAKYDAEFSDHVELIRSGQSKGVMHSPSRAFSCRAR